VKMKYLLSNQLPLSFLENGSRERILLTDTSYLQSELLQLRYLD